MEVQNRIQFINLLPVYKEQDNATPERGEGFFDFAVNIHVGDDEFAAQSVGGYGDCASGGLAIYVFFGEVLAVQKALGFGGFKFSHEHEIPDLLSDDLGNQFGSGQGFVEQVYGNRGGGFYRVFANNFAANANLNHV
jgi:hypothetical protein